MSEKLKKILITSIVIAVMVLIIVIIAILIYKSNKENASKNNVNESLNENTEKRVTIGTDVTNQVKVDTETIYDTIDEVLNYTSNMTTNNVATTNSTETQQTATDITTGISVGTDDKNQQCKIVAENLGWKILKDNGNTVDLIAINSTDLKIVVSKAAGYNNGVKALNEICKSLYGNATVNGTKVSCIYYDINLIGTKTLKVKFKAKAATDEETVFVLEDAIFCSEDNEEGYTASASLTRGEVKSASTDTNTTNTANTSGGSSTTNTANTSGGSSTTNTANASGRSNTTNTANTSGGSNTTNTASASGKNNTANTTNATTLTSGTTNTTSSGTTTANTKLPGTGTRENIGYALLVCSIIMIISAILKYKEKELSKILKQVGLMLVLGIVTLTSVGTKRVYAETANSEYINLTFHNSLIEDSKNVTIGLRKELYTKSKTITVKEIKEKKSTISEITTSSGITRRDEAIIRTGDKVKLVGLEYDVILYGDANKDGIICDTPDLKIIEESYLGKRNINTQNIEFVAANLANSDEKLDAKDAIKMIKIYNNKQTAIVSNEVTGIEPIEVDLTQYLEIGDYVDYEPYGTSTSIDISPVYTGTVETPTTFSRENLQWRILNINEDGLGTIDLIGSPTDKPFYLGGSKGYNNGVYLLNDLCNKLFSNSKIKATARSLNIEDIQNKMDLDVWDYHDYSLNGVKYGTTKRFTQNKKYPYLWSKEKSTKNKIDGNLTNGTLAQSKQNTIVTEGYKEAESSIEVEQTYWYRSKEEMKESLKDKMIRENVSEYNSDGYYRLLCNNGQGEFWLASRFSSPGTNADSSDSFSTFGIKQVYNGAIYSQDVLFYSLLGIQYQYGKSIRPVVSIPYTAIDLDQEYNGKWTIKKN